MKRTFTKLIAVLALLVFMTTSLAGWGQAPVNTVLWSETWTGATTATSSNINATPSSNYGHGTTVYNNGTISYTQSANSVYVRNDDLAGGTAPELLLTSGKTWTISGIPTGDARELTLTYKSNNTKSTVTCSTSGASISGSSKSYTITTGGASTITLVFGCSSNTRIDDVSLIVKTAGTKVATPTFSVGTDTYNNDQNVTISCATTGATIHYTTDGTDPTSSSPTYSSAITVNATGTTIKAIAVKSGMDDSDLASATYTLTCATPTFSVAGGTYDQSQSVEISSATTDATIHYTTNGTTPTASSPTYSNALTVSENTTLKAIAFKSGYNNSDETEAIYNIKVVAPSFTPSAGRYPTTQSVTLSSAPGATIYYTMGDNPADPTTASSVYSGTIEVSATTTIKALAVKENMTNSSLTSATYTIQAPYTTIPALFAAATSTATDVFVTFNNWKVVDVKDNDVYVTDGQYGLRINTANHGFVKGNNLSGTVDCKLSLAYGGIKLSNITASSPGLTVTTSTIGTPYATNIASLDGQYYGSYIDLGELTYQSSGTKFTDGTNTINLVQINQSWSTLTNGKKYFVKGIYTSTVSGNNVTKRISPVSATTDIVPKPVITTNVTALAAPNYYYQTPENNISYEILTISGTDLTAYITVALENGASSDFEMSTDLESWASSVTINKGNGSVSNQSISVRLKAGKTVADYTDKIILTSTDAETKNVNLTGSVVYAHVAYDGNGANVSNVPSDGNTYSYNQEVTVLGGVTRTGYEFAYWTPTQDGSGSIAYEGGDKFSIIEDITFYAQWEANTYNLNAATTYNGSISFTVGGQSATTANTDQTVTIIVTPITGYGLDNLTVTNATTNEVVSVTNNTFTMPGSNVAVSATFRPVVTDVLTGPTIGVNSSTYTEWKNKQWTSDAIYAGKTSGGDNQASKIQLRTSGNDCGIVTTTSGGKVKKIKVTWNSSSGNTAQLDIYGKSTTYAKAENLYNTNTSTSGTILGNIKKGTTELEINNDEIEFIGLRSHDGTIYMDQIEITWAPTTYTLTYNVNGGSGELVDHYNPYIYNQSVTVMEGNALTAPEGKTFQCWNANAAGDGKDYYPGDTVMMPHANKTLYAKWANPCDTPATMNATNGETQYVNNSGNLSYKINLSSSVSDLSECAAIYEYGFVYSTSLEEPTVGAENCTKIVKGNADPTVNEAFIDEITGVPLNTTYYIRSYATNLAGTAYGTTATVTIAEDYPSYTISYTTNGKAETTTTKVYQGNAISELLETPTASFIPTGYTFKGWYGSNYSHATNAPTYVAVGDAISSDMTLKAVFAETTQVPDEKNLEITINNFTEISTSYTTTYTHTYSEATIQAYGVYNNSNGIQMNSGKGTYIKNTTAMPGYITKFVMTWTGTGKNSPTMYANSNSVASTSSTNLGTQSNTQATQTITISNPSTLDYKYFFFDGTTVTGACYMSSFKIYYMGTKEGYINYCTSVADIITDITTDTERSTDIPNYEFVTVQNGATLTLTGNNLGDASNIIVEDGGQLIVMTEAKDAVQATMKKEISAWTTDPVGGWYFIASPLSASTAPAEIENMIPVGGITSNQYDLYRYNQSADKEWQNYKVHYNAEENTFSTLINGFGYLYANASKTTLEFSGAVQPSNSSITVSELQEGYNLVGNPFTCNAYINQDYYMLTGGTAISATVVGKANAIAPCTGIIVEAEANGSVKFSKDYPVTSTNNGNLQMSLSQTMTTRAGSHAVTLDNAIISFNKDSKLGKFYFGHPTANIFIPQGNEEYAIVSAEAQGEMPVSFVANKEGEYTISVNVEDVEMDYLHLIDNIAGNDVDLLTNPSYTFKATNDDYPSRFRLVFSAINNGNDNDNENFAFISNGQIILTTDACDASLQVIDMMGRIVSTEQVNGNSARLANLAKGVYVLRLVGNKVKTQKIVVE